MARADALAPGPRRRDRVAWARAGSGHDRVVRIARNVLPIAAFVLFVALLAAPLTSGREISFVLQKDQIAIAHERLRVTRAVYSGRDAKGEPFQLTAQSAVQQSSAVPVVRLSDLTARIDLPQGPARIVAGRGRYDMTNDRVYVDGPVTLNGPGADHMATSDVAVDLGDRTVRSQGQAAGTTTMGDFRADHMSADLGASTVSLDGGVRLHIPRGGLKSSR